MTKQELKDSIAAVVKNNSTPKLRGNVLKDKLFEIIDECYPIGNNGSTLRSFPKDNTITNAQIGLLAMQKVTPLVQNPETLADFDIKASLCDTVPATDGTKGVYKVYFYNIKLVKPETRIIRVTFNQNPSNGDILSVYKDQLNMNLGSINFIDANGNAENNDVVIGATIADTIGNINNLFLAQVTSLSQIYMSIVGTGADYIDFEMLFGENDDIKYLTSSIINSSTGNISTSIQRDLDINAAQTAQSIFQAANNSTGLWSAMSWDSGNSQMNIITYSSLFRNDSGQPNGTFGAFGLRYFTTDVEAIAGLNWALNNTSGNWFNIMFDVTSALVNVNNNNTYEMNITNKTAPTGNGNTYFNYSGVSNIYVNTNVITSAQSGKPERVPYAVLGRIVDVNANNVLIDASFIFQVVMCSVSDGAMGILSYSDEFYSNSNGYIPDVYAWRGGKVIDFAGYYTLMQNAGFTGDNILTYPITTGALYRPLQPCLPDGTLFVDSKSNISFK